MTPSIRGNLNVYENGIVEEHQSYHQVYSDGRYVYDPRVSSNPIPKGDWVRLIEGTNPDGVKMTVLK